MINALRYEFTRLSTIRSTYWIVGVAIVVHLIVALLISWGSTFADNVADEKWETGIFGAAVTAGGSFGAPMVGAYMLGMLGVLAFGHEYRYGTIQATLTAMPSRLLVFAAKAAAAVMAAAFVAIACVVLGSLAVMIFGSSLPAAGDFWHISGGTIIYFMLFTLWGVALAALVRNQTVAVALLLAVPTVVELLFRVGLSIAQAIMNMSNDSNVLETVSKYLPFDAGAEMYTYLLVDRTDPHLGPVAGGVVFAVFVALFTAAGAYRFIQRDA